MDDLIVNKNSHAPKPALKPFVRNSTKDLTQRNIISEKNASPIMSPTQQSKFQKFQSSRKKSNSSMSLNFGISNNESVGESPSFSIENEGQEVIEQRHAVRVIKPWQKVLKLISNHWLFVIFMTLMTIYALFFDDFRILGFAKDADRIFYGLTVTVFFLFTFEIVAHSIVTEGYFLSFFFWLDVISTLSLIPDIGWITEFFESQATKKASAITKTSRAARVTRIIRIVRVLRLIRIVKLYKQARIAESIKKDTEAKDLEKRLFEELTIQEAMFQDDLMKKRASQMQQMYQENEEMIANMPPQLQADFMRRTSLLPLYMRNDTITKKKEQSNQSLQQYAQEKLFIDPNQQSEESNSMMEKSCEESRASNPQQDKSSQDDDDVPDYLEEESIEEAEKQPSRLENMSQLQVIPSKSKKQNRRQSVAVPVQLQIDINPVIVSGVNKSPAKKSQTTKKQKSEKRRRESVFTNSSKMTSMRSEKKEGSIIQNKFKRFLTMAMRSNISQESSEEDGDQLVIPPMLMKKGTSEMEQNSNYYFDEKIEKLRESKLARTFSDKITQKVIIIILGMLFLQPIFQYESYFSDQTSYQYGINELLTLQAAYGSGSSEFIQIQGKFLEFHQSIDNPLVMLVLSNITAYQSRDLDSYRNDSILKVYARNDLNSYVISDISSLNKMTSILNVCRTLFITVIIAVGIIMFNNDANKLVLEPIERLTEKVKLMAANPLGSMNGEIDKQGILSVIQQQENKNVVQPKVQYETYILEQAFIKIGQLLALGFGEAGAQIIAQNMRQQGDINFKLTGQKCLAIFGFCDIRNFTDATETLETDVMVFVNKIAEIVHAQVDKYLGAANKNIGDAFLLVWKFPDDLIVKEDKGRMRLDQTNKKVSIIADLALFSFLKIISKINKLSHIVEYSRSPELREKIPGYKVRMGFGLHFGWAIEGAIGSEFKIDASYLSPHVNIAARLEAATKQYGVAMLISGDFTSLLSEKVKMVTREIDTVTVKGSKKPLQLYTISIQQLSLKEIIDRFQGIDPIDKKKQRQQEKKAVIKRLYGEVLDCYQLYQRDSDIRELRRYVDADLERKFKKGYTAYVDGDWDTALNYLEKCQALCPEDGPTLTLKSYIESEECIPPNGWKGFRELTEK